MPRITWGERYRAAFIANATKRGFRQVEFREEGGKRVVYCDDGRKGFGPMDAKDEIPIGRWVTKLIEQGKD